MQWITNAKCYLRLMVSSRNTDLDLKAFNLEGRAIVQPAAQRTLEQGRSRISIIVQITFFACANN